MSLLTRLRHSPPNISSCSFLLLHNSLHPVRSLDRPLLQHHLLRYSSTTTRSNTMSSSSKPHPLEFLIGTWSGKGKGFYPNIPTFEYFEEITFTKDGGGRPVVAYSQKTRKAIPGSSGNDEKVPGPPMHAECGYIRIPNWSNENCELLLSQPTGIASLELGKTDGTTVAWETVNILRAPTAKEPHTTKFSRKWTVDPVKKTFDYTLQLATEITPLQDHLEAKLRKVETTA